MVPVLPSPAGQLTAVLSESVRRPEPVERAKNEGKGHGGQEDRLYPTRGEEQGAVLSCGRRVIRSARSGSWSERAGDC